MSQRIMESLDSYQEEKQLNKGEAIDKAVSEYLGMDGLQHIEDRLEAHRDRLLDIASRIAQGDTLEPPGQIIARRSPTNKQLPEGLVSDTEMERFGLREDLYREVKETVSQENTFQYPRDLYHRAIHSMVIEDREERLERLEDDIETLTEYIGSRFAEAKDADNPYIGIVDGDDREHNREALESNPDEYEEPEESESESTDLSPSLSECSEGGRPFTSDELQTVSEYAYRLGREFTLHPERVDTSNVTGKRRIICGLVYGVANHQTTNSDWVDMRELEDAIETVAPDATDETKYYRTDYKGSYLSQVQTELLVSVPWFTVEDDKPSIKMAVNKQLFADAMSAKFGYDDPLCQLRTGGDRGGLSIWNAGGGRKYEKDYWAHLRAGLRVIDGLRDWDGLDDDTRETLMFARATMLREMQSELKTKERFEVAEFLGIPLDERYEWETENPDTLTERKKKQKYGEKGAKHQNLMKNAFK